MKKAGFRLLFSFYNPPKSSYNEVRANNSLQKIPNMNHVGKLLVATKRVDEPHRETVILLVEDSDKGIMGLCLNRQGGQSVNEVWEDIGEENNRKINLGGPVFGPLVTIHRLKEYSETEILPGIYFSALGENVNNIVKSNADYRIYTGYFGWFPNQLELELNKGNWFTLPVTEEFIFYESEDLHTDVWCLAKNEYSNSFLKLLGINEPSSFPSTN